MKQFITENLQNQLNEYTGAAEYYNNQIKTNQSRLAAEHSIRALEHVESNINQLKNALKWMESVPE